MSHHEKEEGCCCHGHHHHEHEEGHGQEHHHEEGCCHGHHHHEEEGHEHHHGHGGCHCHEHNHEHNHEHGASKSMLARIVITAILTIVLQFVPVEGWLRFALFFGVYLIIGWDLLHEAVEGIAEGEVFDENFLMAIATMGAFALALYEGNGDYNEAIAVMLFFQIGEYFQGYAVGKSRKSISELMDIRPDYANIEKDGKMEKVSPEEVKTGDTIIVRPGEKVPIDGIVTEGKTTLNTAALTGESMPRDAKEGDEVQSGSINMTGVIRMKTTKEFGESTVSKILELVEKSGNNKSQSEAFITRFARYYTPIVCYCALALAILPPVFRMMFMDMPAEWETWIYRALTFLVISCPCALVISIPLSFFAGIGGASREGILVKGSNHLETLSKINTVVMDKTGTLTLGVFEVNAIHHNTIDKDQLLEYAAIAECSSSHPISKSLQRAYGKSIDHNRVTEIEETSGHGVTARVDGVQVAAGNEKLMRKMGVEPCSCHTAGTIVHIALDGKYAGHIVLGDIVKPNAKEAIRTLKESGVEHTVMLTGDAKSVAEQVANEIGIDEVRSELLPNNKVEEVESRMKDKKEIVAFVGDGINDAPVLTCADLGMAMGGVGSDAAIEAADVVLMDDDPMKIGKAIRISKKCLSIVWQNIIFAIGVKVLCLVLGAFGVANMWLAIFADVGVMILAIINAIRAMYVKNV